jgi:hypothetical protein
MSSEYKDFQDNEVQSVIRTVATPLFNPTFGLKKPFDNSNGISISVTTSSAFATDPNVFNKISFVNRLVDDTTYFSFVTANSQSFDASSGSGMNFWSFVSTVNDNSNETTYKINDGIFNGTSSELDIIAVSREFYNDAIDASFFSVQMFTGSATVTTTRTEYSLNNGTIGLYPIFNQTNRKNTAIGNKYYLYPVSSSVSSATVLYNSSTDFLTSVSPTDLNKTKPYGEVYTDAGIIVLFKDIIKQDYPNVVTEASGYLGAIVGRNIIRYSSTIYSALVRAEEFNASNNPTYYRDFTNREIKQEFVENPVTFITTVGLYNKKNELIATGRVSTPIKKTPIDEAILRLESSF